MVAGQVKLPYNYPNGSEVFLGDDGLGYPPNLYPNLTYFSTTSGSTTVAEAGYDGAVLSPTSSTLLLGPWNVNSSYSLVSMTMPIINNTSALDVLGWITVILDARLITQVIDSPEGLDQTAEMLVIRPINATNHYPPDIVYTSPTVDQTAVNNQQVNFVLPLNSNESDRHPTHVYGASNPVFPLTSYPAAVTAITKDQSAINNGGSKISTTNEDGKRISAGFAILSSGFCDWVVIIEESQSEVWKPIVRLRNVLLACVFGTLG